MRDVEYDLVVPKEMRLNEIKKIKNEREVGKIVQSSCEQIWWTGLVEKRNKGLILIGGKLCVSSLDNANISNEYLVY